MHDSPIEIGSNQARYSVIWLHGLGADGHDFSPIVTLMNLPDVRFILPHAPYQNVTLNNGYEMRAWYDIYGLSADSEQDEPGIRQSQAYIESLIKHEQNRGIQNQRIILAGFSQGGAIALHTALRHENQLGGVIALSTYLPLKDLLGTEKSSTNQSIPIFMAHGQQDEVISLATSKLSLEKLQSEGYAVAWHEYPVGHSVAMEEVEAIRQFILNAMSEES